MWSEFSKKISLNSEVADILTNIYNYPKITKVQYIVINEFIRNKDVIVKAVTGSGKTLSYVIPMFHRLIKYAKEEENSVNYKSKILSLILLPTRELAEQVYAEINKFVENLTIKFKAQLMIGGKKENECPENLSGDVANVIVATPGRLTEISEKNKLNFSSLELLILDEADRMLDMGFERAVTNIISKLPKQRRTGLFSATVTSNVENLIKAGMRNPELINIFIKNNNKDNLFITEKDFNDPITKSGPYYKITEFSMNSFISNLTLHEVPKELGQFYITVKNIKYKISLLIQILKLIYNNNGSKLKKIMIFLSTCFLVDYFNIILPKLLSNFGVNDFSVLKLHSKISQNKREKEYKCFKEEGEKLLTVLLTTDLSARGIDIPNVDMIIQYDPPKNEDSYIHKIGRTARVGHAGQSLIFLTEEELPFVSYMKSKCVLIKEYEAGEVCGGENVDVIDGKSVLENVKQINISDKWIYDKAVNSVISFLRFYKEIELKYIFDISKLDIGNLCNGFQLLKLPKLKIKEFKMENTKNFVGDSEINPMDLKYKDKNIKKQMDEKKERINKKLAEVFLKKKRKKEKIKRNSRQNGDKLNRTRKEKKEARLKNALDEWEEFSNENKMYRKFKQGKISEEEYKKYLMK